MAKAFLKYSMATVVETGYFYSSYDVILAKPPLEERTIQQHIRNVF